MKEPLHNNDFRGAEFNSALQKKLDTKTKPPGSLGRIEELAAQIARVQNTHSPRMQTCQLSIFAADHGIVGASVSAYPQEVTRQMVLNFLGGGAAANVFARTLGVDVQVIDAGVAGDPIDHPDLKLRRLGPGTANALVQPAMSAGQRDEALGIGRELGQAGDWDAMCFGEMGIGNTSSATLMAHKLLRLPLADITGRGTGLDDSGLKHKHETLTAAAARTAPELDADQAISEYGGFEIAMMTGAMIGAVAANRLVIVDGFIASAAALAAIRYRPVAREHMVFAHRSAERGHKILLDTLGASPLLDLRMRLGEGTGALLAWPIAQSAAAMLNDMASFESAGVSGPE